MQDFKRVLTKCVLAEITLRSLLDAPSGYSTKRFIVAAVAIARLRQNPNDATRRDLDVSLLAMEHIHSRALLIDQLRDRN
jgi:hypothetical protein